MWPLQAPAAPLLLLPLTQALLLQSSPREPHCRQEDTLAPFWQLLPAASSQEWGQARLLVNQERSMKV